MITVVVLSATNNANADNRLTIAFSTTNTDYPDVTLNGEYDASKLNSVPELQSAISQMVKLMWMAHGQPSWNVS